MNVKKLLNDYDWKEVFKYAGPYSIKDVEEIIASSDGENDGEPWIGIYKMKDGKFLVLDASCDYTGWGCQEGGSHAIHASFEEAISEFSLPRDWRERLSDQLDQFKKKQHTPTENLEPITEEELKLLEELEGKVRDSTWFLIPYPEPKWHGAHWRVARSPKEDWANFNEIAFMPEDEAKFSVQARNLLPRLLKGYREAVEIIRKSSTIMEGHESEGINDDSTDWLRKYGFEEGGKGE